MALSDVTREAIEKVLAEYQELGGEEFHTKWGGSDKNVDYHIVWKGDFYPSKTVVNVAHFQVMNDPALSPSNEFSGGLQTIIPVLQRCELDYTEGKINWDREELILALELYFRQPQPGKQSKELVELSALLRQRAEQLGRAVPPRFRNADGIYLKMMNFRRYDEMVKAKGNVGMRRGSNLEGEIWAEWSTDKAKLASAAQTIKLGITSGLPVGDSFADDLDGDLAAEGGYEYRKHRRYERNPANIRKKKASVKRFGLPLACEVCEFDFEAEFGDRGADYIEVHHKAPVHTLKPGTVPKLSDLALLCSNCHRMAHRWGKLLSIEELRAIRTSTA